MEALTYLDYEAINLLLIDGLSITKVKNRTGLSSNRIRTLLSREDIKKLMGQVREEVTGQLKNLLQLATSKLQGLLSSKNEQVVHRAIETIYRTQNLFQEAGSTRLSAEDIIARMLEAQRANVEKGSQEHIRPTGKVDLTVFDEEKATRQ